MSSAQRTQPWKTAIQIMTIAKVNRRTVPRTCNVHKYHVWRWQGLRTQPKDGAKCACGGLDWTHRPNVSISSAESPNV